jgi:hypothetical protein
LVVFGVTFAVATRRSASEHAVSVFKCRWPVGLTPPNPTFLKIN